MPKDINLQFTKDEILKSEGKRPDEVANIIMAGLAVVALNKPEDRQRMVVEIVEQRPR